RPETIDLGLPLLLERLDRLAALVDVAHGALTAEHLGQRLECRLRVADEGQAVELVGVEPGDVDADHAGPGVLEGGLGGGDEVAQAGADRDDDVGVTRGAVGGAPTVAADRAEIPGVVPGDGSLAGLRLGDGDAEFGGEVVEGCAGAAVDDTAPGDDDRVVTLGDEAG